MSTRLRFPRSVAWLPVVATALAVVLGLHGPIAQWAGYHAFADGRAWFGVPNAENVLSNLPFALVGGWGLWAVAHLPQARGGRSAWACFGAAVLCTAFGSALYHWAPSNGALVFDRLPIAWACAALTCALLAERVDARWASPAALTLALLVATASVAWWWLGEHRGVGDLRAYLFVQFLPMALVPAAIGLKLPRGAAGGGLRDRDWWIVLGLYALAKLTELADRPVLEALGLVSGHTLKHLFAAAAALWLLRAATRPLRRPRALATAPIGRTQLR